MTDENQRLREWRNSLPWRADITWEVLQREARRILDDAITLTDVERDTFHFALLEICYISIANCPGLSSPLTPFSEKEIQPLRDAIRNLSLRRQAEEIKERRIHIAPEFTLRTEEELTRAGASVVPFKPKV